VGVLRNHWPEAPVGLRESLGDQGHRNSSVFDEFRTEERYIHSITCCCCHHVHSLIRTYQAFAPLHFWCLLVCVPFPCPPSLLSPALWVLCLAPPGQYLRTLAEPGVIATQPHQPLITTQKSIHQPPAKDQSGWTANLPARNFPYIIPQRTADRHNGPGSDSRLTRTATRNRRQDEYHQEI